VKSNAQHTVHNNGEGLTIPKSQTESTGLNPLGALLSKLYSVLASTTAITGYIIFGYISVETGFRQINRILSMVSTDV